MSHVPAQHEIETFSGKFVDVSNPSADSIALEDIAHALSNICRYGGHCRKFYSVAEHAVFVSRRLERQGLNRSFQLAGLHHDDSEAFLGDIPRPMKPLLGTAYSKMTDRMDESIITALGLNQLDPDSGHAAPPGVSFHDPAVKAADNWSLFVEARHLLPSEGRQWWNAGSQSTVEAWEIESLPSRIVTPDYWYGGLTPQTAERIFIERHKELTT